MAKYSAEFKFEVVQEYLNGHIGYTDLTKKYDIPSKNVFTSGSENIVEWGKMDFNGQEKMKPILSNSR